MRHRLTLAAALAATCVAVPGHAQTARDLVGTCMLDSSVQISGETRTDQFGTGAASGGGQAVVTWHRAH